MPDTTAKRCNKTHWQGSILVPEGLVVGVLDARVNATYFEDYIVKSTS